MKKYLKITLLCLLFTNLFQGQLVAQKQTYSLEQCISYAWEHSTDISRANNSIKSESYNLEQSKAAQTPNLSLNGSQSLSSVNKYTEANGLGEWDRDNTSSLGLSLNSEITLYNGAKLKNTIAQRKTNLKAFEMNVQTERELLSLDVLTAYMNVLLAKEQLLNRKSNFELTTKQLDLAEARKSAGIISTSDYLNIKSQSASDKALVVSAQSNLQIVLVSLMQIMNMPISNSFDIETPNIEALLSEKINSNASYIYNVALGLQSSIASAELNLESADMEIKIAKASALPVLTLNGSLGTSYANDYGGIDFGEQLSKQIQPTIGLSLSIPISQSKEAKNSIAQANIQAENYQLDLIDEKISLRKAIEQACVDFQAADMNFQASLEQYNAEQESYQLAEEMFSQGMINSVDLFTSKNNLVNAENNLSQNKYSLVMQNKIIGYYMGEEVKF